jgi:hypothetical protein
MARRGELVLTRVASLGYVKKKGIPSPGLLQWVGQTPPPSCRASYPLSGVHNPPQPGSRGLTRSSVARQCAVLVNS